METSRANRCGSGEKEKKQTEFINFIIFAKLNLIGTLQPPTLILLINETQLLRSPWPSTCFSSHGHRPLIRGY
jgi:hypothetical protein